MAGRIGIRQVSDNLASLHAEEEKLRVRQLALIDDGREALRDHFNIVREAMNFIYGLTHDHPHASDDELTLQFLGIRLFNSAASSIKLALSGYYQNAFQHLRDILETYFLIDYLLSYREKIPVWLEEIAKALTHAGVIYGSHFADIGLPLLRVKEKYIADVTAWRDRYLSPAQGTSGSPAAT